MKAFRPKTSPRARRYFAARGARAWLRQGQTFRPAAPENVAPATLGAASKLPAMVATAIAVLLFTSPRITLASDRQAHTGTTATKSVSAFSPGGAPGQGRKASRSIRISPAAIAALSQIETGDNDKVVGGVGELSRWQVRPEILKAHGLTPAQARDPQRVRPLVAALLQARCTEFAEAQQRQPNAVEFYALWNAPAQALKGKLSPVVAERAQRFANLYSQIAIRKS